MRFGVIEHTVPFTENPACAGPFAVFCAGYVFREVHALQARPFLRLFQQRGHVELAVFIIGNHAGGCAFGADEAGELPGINARDADKADLLTPGVQVAFVAEVCGLRHFLAHHKAAGGCNVALHIFHVGANIADVGEGEVDDLARVGRVCQDFLVPGHGGVEADFANGVAFPPKSISPEHSAI